MKLSAKQALILYEVAKSTLTINIVGLPHGYRQEYVKQIVEEVANQQSDELRELE